ncbi:hypothetical protein [Vibrio mexicanus]|uniref:hypothetical protein n=1 Tax=Vibrio mexicanus TaxID=1004326 RepID=UPI00063C7B0D|nr:hypothetical protein [Vibrio mexicanus]
MCHSIQKPSAPLSVAALVCLTTLSHHASSAQLHAKSLGEAVSAIQGSNSGWQYNPASSAYSTSDSFVVFNGEYSQMTSENNQLEHNWSSFGVTAGWQGTRDHYVVMGMDITLDPIYQNLHVSEPSTNSDTVGGRVIDYTFGFGYRFADPGLQLGVSLIGSDFADSPVSTEGPLSYSAGLIKEWRTQASVSSTNALVLSGTIGGNYRSKSEFDATHYASKQTVVTVPSSAHLGTTLSLANLNDNLNHKLTLSADIEHRDFLVGFNREKSLYITKLGADWRLFPSQSQLQYSLRGGIQTPHLSGASTLISYGIALNWKHHLLEASSWQEFDDQGQKRSLAGVGYSFIF